MLSLPLDPPSRDDWARFQETIYDQYIVNNTPLRELVNYMELKHAFRATERMYKQRFAEWNIFKYPRAAEKHMKRNTSSKQTSITGVESTSMSRLSSTTSYYSTPSPTPKEEDKTLSSTINACEEPASCSHRRCIQAFLSTLARHAKASADTSITYIPSSGYLMPPWLDPVGQVLYYVRDFSLSWLDPEASSHDHHIADAAAQARMITSRIAGHCSHRFSPKQCERCTWAEFDFGLAMLEDGHNDLAFASFHLGCRLAHLLLSSPSKLFIRNLIMAFGSHRWEKFGTLRHQLLNYLALMSSQVLGDYHSITIVLKHTSCHDVLQQCAERALQIMIEVSETASQPAHPDVLLIKRSLSVILRRQKDYEKSEEILDRAVADSKASNGPYAKETRRCLRRMGHLYMEQCRWDEAEEVFLSILNSAPGKSEYRENWIPDEISVYTYQHLARMASDMGDRTKCRYWFYKELMAAIKRWGADGEYTAECLQLAYNETPPDSLAAVVEHFPDILIRAEAMQLQGKIVVSKARWCAVRNLI